MPPDPNQNRRLGPALRRTDADRARAADISFEDILEARETFAKHAPKGFKGLIEAKTEPTKSD